MVNMYEVPASDLINAVAEKLKKYSEIQPPEGLVFWKTGVYKEFPPEDHENFWFIRCASLLRKIAKHGPIGVNKLRKQYGGRGRRGVKPNRSARASGAIIRRAIQQLERSNLIQVTEHKGRKISNEGQSLLDRIAHQVIRTKPREDILLA